MEEKISIVVPIFNEEENILPLFAEVYKVMCEEKYTWEILFIDDGSTDNSAEEVKKLITQNTQVRLIEFAFNCGQSAAFGAGFDFAEGEIIITLDGDMQNDPKDIPYMLELFASGYDMIIGWRHERKDTFSKKLASKLGNGIRRFLTHDTVHDTGCSLKIMRASMAKKMPLNLKGMHRFMVSLMQLENAKIMEAKVNHRQRYKGISKYNTWTRGFAAFQDLLAVNWFLRRNKRYVLKTSK